MKPKPTRELKRFSTVYSILKSVTLEEISTLRRFTGKFFCLKSWLGSIS